MPLEFIDLNSLPVVAAKFDKLNFWEKKNATKRGYKNEKKDNVEFRKKKMTK